MRPDRIFLGIFALAATCSLGLAPTPTGSVDIVPKGSTLIGPHATRQLVATATGPDGLLADLTRGLAWSSLDPAVASVSTKGQVVPRGDGVVTIVARGADIEARTTVIVSGMTLASPVGFRLDVVPSLSQAGCNTGACHGTPTGKGGLRLSLRGYLPDQDFSTLTREGGGRRINPVDADASVLLKKPLGEVAHEGGLRISRASKSYEYIRDWISEGARPDATPTRAVRLEISPGSRVLEAPAKTQQVAVVAHDSEGRSRDVTPICYFQTSNPDIAEVDVDGLVSFKTRGEVAIIAHYLDLVASVRLTHLVAVPGFRPTEVPSESPVDRAVFAKLNRMRIGPSDSCNDEEFIRRATLDAIGVLPSLDERLAFLTDMSPDRRSRLVETLLDRPEFADFWAMKLADVLRANGRLIQSKGANVYARWIRSRLERRTPLDEVVRDLLTAEGSAFANPAANYFRISRDPESAVEATAQLFLGVRIQCAKCHNHPSERWTQDDYYGFAAVFARVRQKKGFLPDDEVIFASDSGEVRQPRTGRTMPPKALGGPVLDDPTIRDRRARLAAWLTGADNPFFARSLVNRVWYHLLGRGIVEPVDDFRDSNPPSNDELLDALAAGFVRSGYDLRELVRTILTSRTYALSSRAIPGNADDAIYFSHANSKLLPAEVLLDAISTVTGSATAFDGLPAGLRATQVSDSTTENSFLKTFGRPAREIACECERESDSNLSQALQLIGGATMNGKLRDEKGRIAALAASKSTPEQIARELYLVALTREATPTEMATAVGHLATVKDRRQAIEDLAWAIINLKEFLFRH